jgi:hypothetical protein
VLGLTAAFSGDGDIAPFKLSTLALRSFRRLDSCCTRRIKQLTLLPVTRRLGGDGVIDTGKSSEVCVGIETISGLGLFVTLAPLTGLGVDPFARGLLTEELVVEVGDVFSGNPSCFLFILAFVIPLLVNWKILTDEVGPGVFAAEPALGLFAFLLPPSASIFWNSFSCCMSFLCSRSDKPTPNPTAASVIGVISRLDG